MKGRCGPAVHRADLKGDSQGCLGNAQVYDAKVIRYAPDGSVDRVTEMLMKKVTSLFAIHGLGIRGVPEPRFGA